MRAHLKAFCCSVILLAACGANGKPSSDQPFAATHVATFDEPWAMAFLPDRGVPTTREALITEKRGRLFLVDMRTGMSRLVAGTPKVDYGGQGGLGDVVVHPGFTGNKLVYLSWVEAGEGGLGAVVGRAKLNLVGQPMLDGLTVIWRQIPKVSNGSHYGGKDIPDHKARDGFEAPKVWWNPSISPAGLMIYSGKLFPKWKGDAFIGGLSSEALLRVDLDGEKATKGDQWKMGARIREVEEGPDGAIWVLEDRENARLLKLTPKR